MFVQIFASSACTGVVRTIGAPNTPNTSAARSVEASPTPPMMHGRRLDLRQEAARRDPLGRVRDEDVLADPEVAPLLDVAGDELGRAGRDRRAEHQPVTVAEQRQQIVDGGSHLAQVGLDVRERRRPDRDHDVPCPRRVGGSVAQLPAIAGDRPIEQRLGPFLLERHASGSERVEHGRVVIDPEDAQAAIGKAQRQRQTDAPEADDGNGSLVRHVPSRSDLRSANGPRRHLPGRR